MKIQIFCEKSGKLLSDLKVETLISSFYKRCKDSQWLRGFTRIKTTDLKESVHYQSPPCNSLFRAFCTEIGDLVYVCHVHDPEAVCFKKPDNIFP